MTTLRIQTVNPFNAIRQSLHGSSKPSAPKQPDERKTGGGDQLSDLRVLFELYGRPVPKVIGNTEVIGHLLYARDLEKDVQSHSSGGKGGSKSTSTSVTYRFYGAYSLGEARPGVIPVRIWINKTTIYDIRDEANPVHLPGLVFRFYDGSPDQEADPVLVEDVGPSDAQAYRHLTTIWFDGLDISQIGGAVPAQISVELWEDATVTDNRVTISGTTVTDPAISSIAVDWDGGRWFSVGRGSIDIISLTTDAVTSTVTWDYANFYSTVGGMNWAFYLPWVDLLAITAWDKVTGSQELAILEPNSGAVLAHSEFFAASIGGWVTPIQVFTAINQVETYFVGGFNGPVISVTQFDETLNQFDNKVVSLVPSAAPTTVAPGPQLAGASWCFVVSGTGASTKIYRLTILAGGTVTGSEVYTAAETISDQGLFYDASDGGLVIAYSSGLVEKRQVLDDSFDLIWSADIGSGYGVAFNWGDRTTRFLGFRDSTYLDWTSVDLATGDVVTDASTSAPIGNAHMWDEQTGSFFTTGDATNPPRRTYTSVKSSNRQLLRDCLEDLFQAKGYAASDYDFSDVDDYVDFCSIFENVSLNTVIADTARLFGYLLEDSDKIYLRALPTDGSPTIDATLLDTSGHFVVQQDGEERYALSVEDDDEANVPQKVEINYVSDLIDYNWSQAEYARQQFPARSFDQDRVERFRVPYGLNPDEAVSLGAKFLFRENTGRKSVEFVTGLRHLKISPGGVVSVTANGRGRTVRVDTGQTIDIAGGTITHQAREWATDHALSFAGDAGTKVTTSIIANRQTAIYPLMLPLLQRSHDLAGDGLVTYFVLTSRGQADWGGGQGFVSFDNGNTWRTIGAQTIETTLATVVSPLGDTGAPHSTDYDNTITVSHTTGPTSDYTNWTYLQRMNGDATAFAVGKNGRWEIITPQTWTDNGDGTFTGATISRAQLGTEPFTGTHQAGDFCFALKPDYLNLFTTEIDRLDTSALFMGLGYGQSIGEGTPKAVEFDGTAERPYMPHALTATYNSTDGIDLDWEQTTRGNWPWQDGTGAVTMLQNAEEYRVELLDGPGGAVDATYTGITATDYNVPQATLVSLYGTVPATLTAKVYMLSDITGLYGYGREITISTS